MDDLRGESPYQKAAGAHKTKALVWHTHMQYTCEKGIREQTKMGVIKKRKKLNDILSIMSDWYENTKSAV